MGCHRNTQGTYTMFPADLDLRYANSKARIIARNFVGSLLIQKGTGAVNHAGGNAFNFGVNPNNRIIIEDWINTEN
jgi:hypothetical protein